MAHDILIVDDETDIRMLIAGILQDEGMRTREAANSDQALTAIRQRYPSLVILDVWLQDSTLDGLQTLDCIKRDYPDMPVVMISGHGNIEMAVGAIKRGAYDFIEKPFKADRLLLLIERAIEAAALKRENAELRLRAGSQDDLIGTSAVMQQVRQQIARVAPTNSRVLLTGPAGSGKEVAARMLHATSLRAQRPFVVLNCASLMVERLEEELFGVESAEDGVRKVGTLELAHSGTLLLDEVADMPLATQGKIVRVLQDQAFTRVGGNQRVEVDVRVIATSNRDIPTEIANGRFRQDLFYRLAVVPVKMPALVDRRDDIPTLASHFLQRSAEAQGLAKRTLGEDAVAVLQAYSWPGNVRQLRNVMDYLLIMSTGDATQPIRANMLPPEIHEQAPAVLKWDGASEIMRLPLREAREVFEREYLIAQLTRFAGNISRTAEFVGMERSALHRKLKGLGVHGREVGEQRGGNGHGSAAGTANGTGAAATPGSKTTAVSQPTAVAADVPTGGDD